MKLFYVNQKSQRNRENPGAATIGTSVTAFSALWLKDLGLNTATDGIKANAQESDKTLLNHAC